MLLHLFGCLLFESAQIDVSVNSDDTEVVTLDTAQDTDVEDTDTGSTIDTDDTDTNVDTEDTDTGEDCVPSAELCDGIDNDCDGLVDASELDNDGDGYVACSIDANGWMGDAITGGDDCNDFDATVYPNAPELCDGQVNTCGGTLPLEEQDDDGDGYVECSIDSDGWDGTSAVVGGDDCDDTNALGHSIMMYFVDADADGFGSTDSEMEVCIPPTGFVLNSSDCDDDNDTIYPAAPELCDGLNNDCLNPLPTNEMDDDGDGYVECSIDVNGWMGDPLVIGGGDCDDTDGTNSPTNTWYPDNDGDGFGVNSAAFVSCIQPVNAVSIGGDCNDVDATVYPNAPELCDGQVNACATALPSVEIDDDGDGYVECSIDANGWDGDSAVVAGDDCDDTDANTSPASTWFYDNDGDGFGGNSSSVVSCVQPTSSTSIGGDCDDADATVYPSAPELCDGQVNACATALSSIETDDDGDGYVECSIDTNGWDGDSAVVGGDDCDDTDNSTSPLSTWFYDNDGDGFGGNSSSVVSCVQPTSSTSIGGDCDDADATVYPNAPELCDGQVNACSTSLSSVEIDNDGDGYVECSIDTNGWDGTSAVLGGGDCDDADGSNSPTNTWYYDNDGDGFGGNNTAVVSCVQPTSSTAIGGDCDDADSTVYPNAPELCDGQVNACATSLPSVEIDDDGDGYVECSIDANGWDGDSAVVAGDDCDDMDANTSPASTWYYDNDGDGFGDAGNTTADCLQPTGYLSDNTDCDDGDGTIYPNAPEVAADGVDQDCDGQDLIQIGMVDVVPEDLLITEVMYRAYGGEDDDWFEVYNASSVDIDLQGLEVYTNNGGFTVNASTLLSAGEYVVFLESSNSAVNGNFPIGSVNTIETGLLLHDLGDTLSLEYAGTSLSVMDLPDYRVSNIPRGFSWVLSDYDAPQEDPANWCFSESFAYVQNNNDIYYATPGFPNDSCDQDGDGAFYWDCDDTDPTLNVLDSDGDGFSSCDGDCDDTNENLSPLDQDGDGLTTCDGDCDDLDPIVGIDDQDNDGFSGCTNDCNDGDPGIYPGQLEVMNDGIDQDCNGVDLIGFTADMLIAGDLRITEIQHNTDRRNEKWYEFYNASEETVDLFGLSLEANNDTFTIQEHLFMPPHDYFVAGRNADPSQNGGVAIDVETGQNLNRDEDWISIFYDDGQVLNIISEIHYLEEDDWESFQGRSKVVYDAAVFPNDNLDFWCISSSAYSNGSSWNNLYGTPGEENDSCDYDMDGQFIGDCDNQDATIFTGAGYLDDPQVCMEDGDGDGWGSPNASGSAVDGTDCNDTYAEMNNDDLDGDGLTTCDGDCDDNNPAIGIIDNDQDGQSGCGTPWSIDCDDNDPYTYAGAAYNQSGTACRTDADGDGYGDNNPASGVTAGNDCNDNNPNRHPGKAESVNGIDDDCDGIVDEGTVAYDDDGDGFTENQGDCKDNNANAYPGAAPNDSTTACMEDADGDGFGDLTPPAGVTAGTDCLDSNALAYPGAAHLESSVDCMADNDGDGFGNSTPSAGVTPGLDCDDYNALVNPAEPESTNSIDDDCDGLIDENNGIEPAR